MIVSCAFSLSRTSKFA